ncbi:putative protein kinase and PP2C-like domain-containing protein-like [Capsicum annuum]|uniref:probable aquaporin SIP2-1 isoform X2 n=1 Tax=Capsicum annuum TaxID=4072 RepID=UPI0007BFE3CB|nr:probable aquaporin SIP2-1 isoform X2 [Capsicum annuum]KAF3612861.1 putative protein kinase and PP2C-like domain-containing protein-like [Capsicum annuum]
MTATYSVPPNKESTKPKEKMGLVSRRRLVVSDFIMSFMWVWSSVLIKMFVHTILGYGAHDLKGDILKHAISVINMFFFAFLVKATKGGAYNPLTILSGAISGDLTNFIFTVAARIPAQILLEAETNSIKSSRCFSFNATGTVQRSRKAKTKLPVISHKSPQSRLPLPEQNYPLQVFGSITGVRLIIAAFPNIGRGPRLSIDIHRGALTEGCLTFAIVSISLGLSRRSHASTFMKTWISSLSKLTLHILGSDLTGGCMNPASVMGWAYARGDHITKEHIHVYWLAPIQATLLSVWTFNLLVSPPKDEKDKQREKKSE